MTEFDFSLFKTAMKASCVVPNMFTIANFGRKELEQTGTGHFACIAGYHRATEKVLLLDTARFKYPPFWVDLEQLHKSVCSVDRDSGKNRGFLILSHKDRVTRFESELQDCVPNRVSSISEMN